MKVVSELCEWPFIKSTCHHIKMQRGGLQNLTSSGKNLPYFKNMFRIIILNSIYCLHAENIVKI